MSLRGYQRKTKPAPWLAMKHGLKPNGHLPPLDTAAARIAALRAQKPRKRVRAVSKKRVAINAEYRKLRTEFLSWNPNCHCCGLRGRKVQPAAEVHHRRGRGRWMLATETWAALCADCHRYIHDKPAWALKVGMMELRNTK